MGEGKGGMIGENNIETYTLPHVKEMTSASLMHEAGHPKLVFCDNPEGRQDRAGLSPQTPKVAGSGS